MAFIYLFIHLLKKKKILKKLKCIVCVRSSDVFREEEARDGTPAILGDFQQLAA